MKGLILDFNNAYDVIYIFCKLQPDINHINIAYNCRFTYIIQDPAVTHMQGEITEGAQHLQTGM